MRVLSVPLFLLVCASPAAAQPAPPIHVPPVELFAGLAVEHKSAGATAGINGNLTRNIAVLSEVGTSPEGVSVLAGARVGTAFYYDGKPPFPGRFFAQIMAGRQRGKSDTAGSIVQPGAGADVILIPRRGVSLHWSIDYRYMPGAPPDRSGARFVVGLLLGPHTTPP